MRNIVPALLPVCINVLAMFSLAFHRFSLLVNVFAIKHAGAENDAARFKPTDPNSLPRRLFNLLSTKKTKRTLCSARMLQACLNNIEASAAVVMVVGPRLVDAGALWLFVRIVFARFARFRGVVRAVGFFHVALYCIASVLQKLRWG